MKEKYFAIYIDALFINLRRNIVKKKALHIALGIDQEGKKEILGFWINPTESSNCWELIINDLRERRVKKVLLFIADGPSGIQETIRKYYPRADFQSYIVHAERNLISKIRSGDKYIIDRVMKRIFDTSSEEDARKRFNEFKEEWNNKYPKAIYNMETRLDILLTYYKYPESIRKVIRSTNMIERLNKEIRRRIKIIDSLPGEESARKIIYLRIIEENNKYSGI
ncbi:MAG: IS256 family transposase, partial [Thermoplasmata archaeon]